MCLLIPYLFILFLNPFVAGVSGCFYCYSQPKLTVNNKYLLCFMPSLFLALFNSTKIPNNDLIWYLDFYSDAGKYNLFDYFYWIGHFQSVEGIKEPAYTIFTYISYYLFGGNRQLFVLFHSLLCYTLINYSLIKFGDVLKSKSYVVVASVIYADFCPYIFVMSAHLLRQILANALLIYIITDIIKLDKFNIKHFVLCVIMMLTHSSSALFIPLLFIKYLKNPIASSNIWIYSIVFASIFFIQQFATFILPYVAGLGPIELIVSRASHGTTYEMEGLNTFKILVSVLITFICVAVVYKSKYKRHGRIVQFTHLMIILCVFFLSNIQQPEMAIRYNFYIWLLSPLVLLLLLQSLRVSKGTALVYSIAFILLFILKMEFGETWDYTIKEMFIYAPLGLYF